MERDVFLSFIVTSTGDHRMLDRNRVDERGLIVSKMFDELLLRKYEMKEVDTDFRQITKDSL